MVTTRRKLPRIAKKDNIYKQPQILKWEKAKYYKKSTFPQIKKEINNNIVSSLNNRARRAIVLDDQNFTFSGKLFAENSSIHVDVCENNEEALKKKKKYLIRHPIQGVVLHSSDLNLFVEKTSTRTSLIYADFTSTLNDNLPFFSAIETNKSLFERQAVLAITYSSRNNKRNFLNKLKSSLIDVIDDIYDVRRLAINNSITQKQILFVFFQKDFEVVEEYAYPPMHSVIFKKK